MSKTTIKSIMYLALASCCYGTQQVCDTIVVDGKPYRAEYPNFPLEDYWSPINPRPETVYASHCWRGFIATWEITDRLLLTALHEPSGHNESVHVPLSVVFPDANSPIHAHWFSGVIDMSSDNDRLFVSFDKGHRVGSTRLCNEQVETLFDTDLNWHELFGCKKHTALDKADDRAYEWLDANDFYSFLSPRQSGGKFKIRGMYFPGGKIWMPPLFHFRTDFPNVLQIPNAISPVELVGTIKKSKKWSWQNILVSKIKVLPIGSVIQKGKEARSKPAIGLDQYAVVFLSITVILSLSWIFVKCRKGK